MRLTPSLIFWATPWTFQPAIFRKKNSKFSKQFLFTLDDLPSSHQESRGQSYKTFFSAIMPALIQSKLNKYNEKVVYITVKKVVEH